MASVEKTYADALFMLCEEEKSDKAEFESVLSQLGLVQTVLSCENDSLKDSDFIKLLGTPTISEEEKLSLVADVFSGKVSPAVYNFLRLLTVNKRVGYFSRISRAFRLLYNEKFGIAEITVTSSKPLDELSPDLRVRIGEKMSAILGKSVSITEKVDSSIIGGVVIDYGNTRYDGSVKTRLAELKKEISSVIA